MLSGVINRDDVNCLSFFDNLKHDFVREAVTEYPTVIPIYF